MNSSESDNCSRCKEIHDEILKRKEEIMKFTNYLTAHFHDKHDVDTGPLDVLLDKIQTQVNENVDRMKSEQCPKGFDDKSET